MVDSKRQEGFDKTKPSNKEPIKWNRITTIIATIVVLFFFTRSAPFPSTTFWELTIARDLNYDIDGVLFPETLSLKISDSSISLTGLKAIYHIIYFILCSSFCFWIFKNKEPLPGLIGLSIFTFSMQVYLNLRMLLTLSFIMGILFLLDQNHLKNNYGIVFIPIIAAASGLGLNTVLLLTLIICYVLCNKRNKISFIVCATSGGLFSPEGFITALDKDSIFNWNFMPKSEMEILYVLSGMFLFINLISLGKMTSKDLPNLIFYVITGFYSLIQPTILPIFITMGLFFFIKLYSDQKPLPLKIQMLGLLAITTVVYLYLFINPFGIKLNPIINNQLGKELAPILDGYVDSMEIEKFNIGELAWKDKIRCDQEKIHYWYSKKDLILKRISENEYRITEPPKTK